jgi:CheY-like chemotaxis protein
VNDDLIFMGLLRDFLEGEGYAVATWGEAEGALDLIRNETPDLVILDIRMEQPQAGRRILELLKLDYDTASIPVIVCSADSRFLIANQAFLATHASAVLEKPVDLDELLAVVVSVLG